MPWTLSSIWYYKYVPLSPNSKFGSGCPSSTAVEDCEIHLKIWSLYTCLRPRDLENSCIYEEKYDCGIGALLVAILHVIASDLTKCCRQGMWISSKCIHVYGKLFVIKRLFFWPLMLARWIFWAIKRVM